MEMNLQMTVDQAMDKDVRESRDLEASLLVRAALMLKDCQERWSGEGHETRLDDALRFNQRLWTLFQAELASEENLLPSELRNNLLNLSRFVDRRTFETFADPAAEKLGVLININRNIAEGLAGEAAPV